MRQIVAIGAVLLSAVVGHGEELLSTPLLSPDAKYAANVEWQTLSQVGLLRMRLYTKDLRLLASIEVPQVRPNPADLTWLDSRWVMCESFLGERASAFYYVDAERRRGYLLEIYALRKEGPWTFDVAYTDPMTSFTVNNASVGRMCLFPIILGAAPLDEESYFTLEFCQKFAQAVDAFRDWKKSQRWKRFDVIGETAVRVGTGGLALCLRDGQPCLVYFRLGSRTPQECLQSSQLINLPTEVREVLLNDADKAVVAWGVGTSFRVGVRAGAHKNNAKPELRILYEGTIAGATDTTVTLALDTEIPEPALHDETAIDAPLGTPQKSKASEVKSTSKRRPSSGGPLRRAKNRK